LQLTLQIQLPNYLEIKIAEVDTQKKIKKRNKKLQDPKVLKLCSDYQKELQFLWSSDPDRQGKQVYDSGEVEDLNKQWQKDAVRRDPKKGLIRVSTGRPVSWSDSQGKWVDTL
jgi:hypothetical protein